jgi:hypothetical protein
VKSSKKNKQPLDSWEDEELSSGEETDRPLSTQTSADYPNAPPPTPISPTSPYSIREPGGFHNPFEDSWTTASVSKLGLRNDRNVRPEKTDGVARRLIAGALGVKAPKRTEEQRAYDRAVKEKEMKRRNGEKEAKMRAEEEVARAKAAAWSD